MVITDFDNGYTSREATGRFQIALGSRPPTAPNSVKRDSQKQSMSVELQCARDRARAISASRRIDQTYRQH